MDIFGTVVSAADLAVKVVGYIQAVKGAKEDRRRLLPEISALGALLQVLRGRLGDSTTNGAGGSFSSRLVMAGIEAPLRECEGALRDTVTRLERLVLDVNTGKSFSFTERMRDIRWPFRQEEIGTMLDRIERLKSLVSLAFQTSLMEFVEKAHDELAAVGLNVTGIESAVSAIEADQRAHAEKTESLYVDLQALGWTLRDSANSIAKIESTIAIMNRNQQDQLMKESLIQADLAIIKEGRELQEVLKWLSPLDFNGKHNAAFEKHAPGTGEWFLGHPKFLAWQQGEYKVLWCPGGPGVGKSVMASAVVRRLQERTSENMAVVYIYFDYTIKYAVAQLLEALLSQLMRRRTTRSGMESLRSYMAGNRRPTLDELINILKAEAETYTRVFVVIDALDETDIQIWAPLLGHLRRLSGTSILATSRDTGEIRSELQPDQQLDIMADKEDIRKYIGERLSSSTGTLKRLLEANMSLHEEIVTGIVDKAVGMFLLARLHMNSLEKRARITDLRRALNELPRDLKTTYDETIRRINDEDEPLAYHIFSWLMHAAQPMTIHDLQYALAVEEGMSAIDTDNLHDEGYLLSICVGLVVLQDTKTTGIHQSGKVVGLVHYTTQQYLHDCASVRLPHPAHLAITCLCYISFGIFDTDGPLDDDAQKQLLNIPFAQYAIFCWGEHTRMHFDNTTVWDLAMQLLHDDQRVATVGSCPCSTRKPSATHLCAHFGLKDCLEYLLDNGFNINSKDSEGDTAVSEAAICGQEEVMQLLLARDGVDVNPKGGRGTTPLSWAIIYGQQGTVELLLARDDVDTNSRDNHGTTPIAHAAQWGHDGVVKSLLAREDVDANSRDKYGMTPITHAAQYGRDGIVKLLLARKDVDTNSCDNYGRMLIAHAARGGNCSIVELLLAREDVDANSRDNYGMTPIAHAAHCGHDGIVKLLLAREDVDANSRDNNGTTPIAHAAEGGNRSVVELLLARGDINFRDDKGSMLITYAACGGNRSIVELLLARDGVDANSRDNNGMTPIAHAVQWGRNDIVELLLAREDVDPNLRDNDGWTLIAHAARIGAHDIVELLLARDDVDINSQDIRGDTVLASAIRGRHEVIVQLLLARDDLNLSLKNNDGDTHLAIAARYGDQRIMKLLLAGGDMDVNSRNLEGATALTYAAGWAGNAEIMKLLFEQDGIDVNPVDSSGATPLDHAEREVAKFLLEQDPVYSRAATPLDHLDREQRESIVQLLREAGGRTGEELQAEARASH